MIKAKSVIDVCGETLICKEVEGLGKSEGDTGIHMPRLLSGHLGVKLHHITTAHYQEMQQATETVYWVRQEAMHHTVSAYGGDTISTIFEIVLDQLDPSIKGE